MAHLDRLEAVDAEHHAQRRHEAQAARGDHEERVRRNEDAPLEPGRGTERLGTGHDREDARRATDEGDERQRREPALHADRLRGNLAADRALDVRDRDRGAARDQAIHEVASVARHHPTSLSMPT